jgi:hypothetical protein
MKYKKTLSQTAHAAIFEKVCNRDNNRYNNYLKFADVFTKINYIVGVFLPRLTAGILAKVTGKITVNR